MSSGSSQITCPVCDKNFRAITTQHIRVHGYLDVVTFKATFGLPSLKCLDMRTKHSARMSGALNSMAGGHTPESRAKIAQNRKGKGIGKAGKYPRTAEVRAKIALGVIRHLTEVGCSGRGQRV